MQCHVDEAIAAVARSLDIAVVFDVTLRNAPRAVTRLSPLRAPSHVACLASPHCMTKGG
jgi:hypothetical protein